MKKDETEQIDHQPGIASELDGRLYATLFLVLFMLMLVAVAAIG